MLNVPESALEQAEVPAAGPEPGSEETRQSTAPALQDSIAAARLGDAAAFDRLVEHFQQGISARMWRFTRDHHQHEELVQEVFIAAFRSLEGFRGEAPFEHWLNRIATRTGYRFWRKRDRSATLVPLNPEECARLQSGEDQPESARQAADLLHSVLARLPPRDRLVLTLIYWEESSIAEAAEQTGWSQTMVKVQAHRARKKLKKLIEGKLK
ncbi:MAG: sigma-70 family RNA polymerase sigma factor [Planctomycetaceae bacterium]|nr:sigma-70 family RNA polymerase sigma factor [Planctomycetaceae bacterium]